MSKGLRAVVLLFLVSIVGACGGSSITNPAGDAGSTVTTGDAPVCVPLGESCSTGTCCAGTCDSGSHLCVTPVGCVAAGKTCGPSDTCCTGTCTGGSCSTALCVVIGDGCTQPGDCCSGTCTDGKCAAVTTACRTEGEVCSDADPGACCSKSCVSGRCVTASGPLGCSATGDICYQNGDCCSSLCNATGGKPGTCQALRSGGCSVGGEPCRALTECCSRVCAPMPGGGNACQIATGCRITGDTCHASSDCCGSTTSNVECQLVQQDPPLGFCGPPNGNQPEGNVCHFDLGDAGISSAQSDCLGCPPPKYECCRQDGLGVPRCYGGACKAGYNADPDAGCCVAAGQECKFSSECCGGVPCVPTDNSGTLHCSGSSCVAESGVCTATGDCCTGLECVVPVGQPSGVCKKPSLPDGGTTTCALGGQRCGDSTACCNGYVCDQPNGTSCPPGATDCTCFVFIP